MKKKYELTSNYISVYGKMLYRIRALRDFGDIKKGDLGGYVESEKNLRQFGHCWVYDNAVVFEEAIVSENAKICNRTMICGHACVYGDSTIHDDACVTGNVYIRGNAKVKSYAVVKGSATISGDALITSESDYATIGGFGSAYRDTTFFRLSNGGIGVQCGCFYGTIEEFRKKVIVTHGNTKYAKEYLAIADLMENHFRRIR